MLMFLIDVIRVSFVCAVLGLLSLASDVGREFHRCRSRHGYIHDEIDILSLTQSISLSLSLSPPSLSLSYFAHFGDSDGAVIRAQCYKSPGCWFKSVYGLCFPILNREFL